MKSITMAAIRCSLMFTAVAALSLAHPASVQAVPTTYQYIGNPFTVATGPYTTSDFVTVMVTLAGPLAPNMPLTQVTPIAFTLSDGVQTITNTEPLLYAFFNFSTDPHGFIVLWSIHVNTFTDQSIFTSHNVPLPFWTFDFGFIPMQGVGQIVHSPGEWNGRPTLLPDAGSTLSLMTLTLMTLGVVARQFKRAAA